MFDSFYIMFQDVLGNLAMNNETMLDQSKPTNYDLT